MGTYRVRDMLKLLRDKVGTVCTPVFVQTRPKSVDERMEEFAVVSLPVMIYTKTHGQGYGWTNSYCRVEIYVRDRGYGVDINRLTELQEAVCDMFPISEDGILVSRPRVIPPMSDGCNFHVTVIQATIQTL